MNNVREAHITARNDGDVDAWVAAFTDDGVQMLPKAPANLGRERIRAWSQAFFAPFRAEFMLVVDDVRVASDWAFERGTYQSNLTPKAGGEPMQDIGKVNIPVEAGNAAAKAGKLGTIIQSIPADLKPEAVYFTDDHGQRTAFLFLGMQDASQIPAIAEPWFLAFNASIEIHPVMVPDDLAKAGSAIEAAVNKYR